MGVYGKSDKPTGPVDWRAPAVFVATGFWAGRIPWAPGTWGAAEGLALAWGLSFLPDVWLQAAVIIALNLVGVPLCTAAARRFGGVKDPSAVVWDEIATVPIAFFLIPDAVVRQSIILAAGFALHRLFDITKPPPARQLERLPDGLGIMADDWAAGALACLAMHALHWAGAFGSLWP
ncbi:MAG TPA: phosphatidylglycerophosphatase A [Pirellulales bacterium]